MNPTELIKEKLHRGDVVLLSGGFSTELHRRGVRTELPLWSAGINFSHPDLIVEVHTDYIRAGADIITANTFRTNLRTFRKAGQAERAAEATNIACALALRARAHARSTPHRWADTCKIGNGSANALSRSPGSAGEAPKV